CRDRARNARRAHRLATTRHRRSRLRSLLPAERGKPDLCRAEQCRGERHQPPRPGLPENNRGLLPVTSPRAPPGAPLGVSIHWPFCRSKCPYCDFNSHVQEGVDQGRWRAALLAELEHAAREAPGRRVETIFFGGGTPSLMEPATAAAVIARVKELWPVADDLEVTLEANPTSVEAGRFAELAAAGVNRLSLGVQSLDPEALRFLGREHSVVQAVAAIDTARRCFARYSFDLIYARPGQTPQAW